MPVARFQMPDGRIAKFSVPEGTTPEKAQELMEAAMADPGSDLMKAYTAKSGSGGGQEKVDTPPPPPPGKPEPGMLDRLENYRQSAISGLTDAFEGGESGMNARLSALTRLGHNASFGTDTIFRGINHALNERNNGRIGLTDLPRAYREGQQQAERENQTAMAYNPDAANAGEVGSFFFPLFGLKAAEGAKSVIQAIKSSAGAGAKIGGVAGAGLSENTIEGNPLGLVGDTALGTATGAGIGGALGGLGTVIPYQKGKMPWKPPKDLDYLKNWARKNNIEYDTAVDLADRFAGYQGRKSDVANLGHGANDTVNSVFSDLRTELNLLVDKARVTRQMNGGDFSAGEERLISNLTNKEGAKTKNFDEADERIARKIFGDDYDRLEELMKTSDALSSHLGSMKEILGTVSNAIESRTSSGNLADAANVVSLGLLKSGNRGLLQPWNPVNQLGKSGESKPVVRREQFAQELDELTNRKKALDAKAKLDSVEGSNGLGQFDPESDVGTHVGFDPVPIPEKPPVVTNDPERVALAKLDAENLTNLGNLKLQRGDYAVTPSGGIDLPTTEVEKSVQDLQQAAQQANNLRNLKIKVNDANSVVLGGDGWRGEVVKRLGESIGDVTKGDFARAEEMVQQIIKASDPETAKLIAEASGRIGGRVPPAYMNLVRDIIRRNKVKGLAKSDGGGGSPVLPGEDLARRVRLEKGTEAYQSIQSQGYKSTPLGDGRATIEDPSGNVIGIAESGTDALRIVAKYQMDLEAAQAKLKK